MNTPNITFPARYSNLCMFGADIRELVQFAALLLVSGSEFLVLHLQALLLQHDLLVLTADKKKTKREK